MFDQNRDREQIVKYSGGSVRFVLDSTISVFGFGWIWVRRVLARLRPPNN
jgi:hypothetical protein